MTNFLIIFWFCLFVVLDKMTKVNSCANAFQILTITLVNIVAPCDLWPVITYARTIGQWCFGIVSFIYILVLKIVTFYKDLHWCPYELNTNGCDHTMVVHMDQCQRCSLTINNFFAIMTFDVNITSVSTTTWWSWPSFVLFNHVNKLWVLIAFVLSIIRILFAGANFVLKLFSLYTMTSSQRKYKIVMVTTLWSEITLLSMKHALNVSSIFACLDSWTIFCWGT